MARPALSWFRRKPKTERIDPFTLTDPWRSFVQDAQQAQTRFGRIVATVTGGPLRERLVDINDRVADGVHACWRIARTGYQLHKALLEVADTPSDAVTRMRARETDTQQKLAALTKSLNEAVARAAELATGQLGGLDALAGDVDSVVDDLEALRQAIAEVSPS
ncbi:MAG TPA: hypothetical protein VHD87_12040 [Acidimicrobiales bacterium]|nr:hypothetical protein [Acidimicrobiales bacterium]